jgi:hypothetical protein
VDVAVALQRALPDLPADLDREKTKEWKLRLLIAGSGSRIEDLQVGFR